MGIKEAEEILSLKVIEFFFSLGFFGELILFLIVSINLYKNVPYLVVYYVGFVINTLLNQSLKTMIKSPRPVGFIKFLADEKVMKGSNSYGLPSGHTQNVFYSLIYLYLTGVGIYPWLGIGVIISMITIIERWEYHNHTLTQLLAGSVVGGFFAYLITTLRNELLTKIKI